MQQSFLRGFFSATSSPERLESGFARSLGSHYLFTRIRIFLGILLAFLVGGCGSDRPHHLFSLFSRFFLGILLVFLVVGCESDKSNLAPPAGSLSTLSQAPDANPDPDIVEVFLEASASEVRCGDYDDDGATELWTYNGQFPGPVIHAKAGDLVIVHFTNHLTEPTTIHWYGVRLENAMDGVPEVQTPVPPDGTFDYRFVVPDAGLYWYHAGTDSFHQVSRGLIGELLVEDPSEPRFSRERVMVLTDLRLGRDGTWNPPEDEDHDEDEEDMSASIYLSSHDEDEPEALDSNLVLVNGKRGTRFIEVRSGERERWRIVNASLFRFYRLKVPSQTLTVIGTDGGLLEHPQIVEDISLAPGERLDVIYTAEGPPSTTRNLVSVPYRTGARHYQNHRHGNLLHIRYTDQPPVNSPAIPENLRTITEPGPPVLSREVRMTVAAYPPSEYGGEYEDDEQTFFINGATYPDVPPFTATLGSTERWTFVNDTGHSHPMHIHGVQFLVESRNGVLEPWLAWKDTVEVKAGEQASILLPFDGFPGQWMYHCQILKHAEKGLKAEVDVQ